MNEDREQTAAEFRQALRETRERLGKQGGRDCDAEGCTRTVGDGVLHRVNPKGQSGIFMCEEHARFVDSWEQRITAPASSGSRSS